MERDGGLEAPASGATGRVQSFYLVGAPGTRKSEIATELVKLFGDKLTYVTDLDVTGEYALGVTADYRIELKLATSRLFRQDKTAIYTHSVLDNLAYVAFAFNRYQISPGVRNEAAETMMTVLLMLGIMVKDSFTYDHVFLLERKFSVDDDYESAQIQAALRMILNSYEINHTVIDLDQEPVDRIAEVLGAYLND